VMVTAALRVCNRERVVATLSCTQSRRCFETLLLVRQRARPLITGSPTRAANQGAAPMTRSAGQRQAVAPAEDARSRHATIHLAWVLEGSHCEKNQPGEKMGKKTRGAPGALIECGQLLAQQSIALALSQINPPATATPLARRWGHLG